MINIAIFASGNGSNMQAIYEHLKQNNHLKARIAIVLSNNKNAYVLERAKILGIPYLTFDKKDLYESTLVLNILKKHSIDFIVLAGFLLLVPENIIKEYPKKIVNIHPALLPKFGGKGMYGKKVHEAVIAAGEKESGITIHYVNEQYDAGEIIFQAKCSIDNYETVDTLEEKIHKLEHKYYPIVISELISNLNQK